MTPETQPRTNDTELRTVSASELYRAAHEAGQSRSVRQHELYQIQRNARTQAELDAVNREINALWAPEPGNTSMDVTVREAENGARIVAHISVYRGMVAVDWSYWAAGGDHHGATEDNVWAAFEREAARGHVEPVDTCWECGLPGRPGDRLEHDGWNGLIHRTCQGR